MELIKLRNTPSKLVGSWSQIADEAEELIKFFDENDGKFKGEHPYAYAIAHCQVSAFPYAFFVVNKALVELHNLFPARVIINAKILEGKDIRRVDEGCLSFPYRKSKKVERYSEVKVEFQILGKSLTLETKTGWVKWPASQVFQHEIYHFMGKNIYFD